MNDHSELANRFLAGRSFLLRMQPTKPVPLRVRRREEMAARRVLRPPLRANFRMHLFWNLRWDPEKETE